MRRNKVGILSLLATVGLGACGDDGAGPDTTTLSEQESAELVAFILGESFSASGVQVSGQQVEDNPLLARAIVEFDDSQTIVASCPLGGSVTVDMSAAGYIDDASAAFEIDASQVQTHDACSGQGENGFQFTVDGAPNLATDIYMTQDESGQNAMAEGSIAGGVMWTAGQRSGTCLLDVSFSLSTSAESGNFSIAGSACGHSMTRDVSVSTS
jgi:hypothetical protein